MNQALNILHLEDSPSDALLIQRTLKLGGLDCVLTVANNRPTFVAALAEGQFDLVLSDFQLPQFSGPEALQLVRAQRPELPVVFVTGVLGEEQAIEMLKLGATDYVLKDRLQRLVPCVRRALAEAAEQSRRRKAEAALRASELRLRRAQEIAHVGSWELDLLTDRLTWSEETYRIMGLPVASTPVSRTAFYERIHPEDRTMVIRAYADAVRDNRDIYELEHRIVRADTGEIRFVHERCEHLRDATGKIVGSFGMVQDVTERIQAEAARTGTERQLREVMQHARCMLWSGRVEGLPGWEAESTPDRHPFEWHIEAHDVAVAQRIWPIEMLPGRPYIFAWGMRRPWEDLLAANATSARALRSGAEDYAQDFRIIDGHQQLHWIHEDVAIQKLAPGVWHVYGVATDVTERKLAEATIRQVNGQLEATVRTRTAELVAANEELEAFSYSISHDLRTPLRAVLGFGRALQEDCAGQLDAMGREHLQRILKAGQQMTGLTESLLSLAQLSRVPLQTVPVDLTALAHEVAEELQALEPTRLIEFRIAENLHAAGDPRLLRVALTNLLDNARKFTAQRKPAQIEFGRTEDAAHFVRDNGAGFDMAQAGRLFTPFQRLHSAEDFPGSGIGLAIVSRVVHRHGGRLWAESAVDRGATFYFTLKTPTDTGR